MIKIVVDLQGADRPASELLTGVSMAVREIDDLSVCLVGKKESLENEISKLIDDDKRYEVVDSEDSVSNSDNPMNVIKEKPDASMIKGLKICRDDPEAGGFVTCGPTGVLYVTSLMILGRAVKTTATLLCPAYRNDYEPFCIVDCGAVTECTTDNYVDFARMGVAYMKAIGVSSPKVALLSNGAEDNKGTGVVKEVNKTLRKMDLDFIGNIEGNNVLKSNADVIVCDGFSGNILMKTLEGTARTVMSEAMDKLEDIHDLNLEKVKKILFDVKEKYNYNDNGGAILLGVNRPVIKGHGAASPHTIYSIIRNAYILAKNDLVGKVVSEFN